MSVERPDFDLVGEADLNELVVGQVAEGIRIDFKRTCYGTTEKDRSDLAGDVAAFANTFGGHLVLGVEEVDGVATHIIGISHINADAELLRMEQIIRAGIEPRISGIRMKSVQLSNGGTAIVVRIPKSWNPPHRVSARGLNRFYIRHSSGNHEPSVEELRVLFSQSADAITAARRFREERIAVAGDRSASRPLIGNGRLYLHMFPSASNSGQAIIDIEQALRLSTLFRPLGADGMTPKFNYYGFINERGGAENHGYTQVFKNGCLEATVSGLIREINGARLISGIALERKIVESLPTYVAGLRTLGAPPPIVIMLTLEGVSGVEYAVNADRFEANPRLPEDTIRLPECVLQDFGSDADHRDIVRPALDTLWNAIGYARDQFFNQAGKWQGRQ